MRRPTGSRDVILDAAQDIVVNEGVANLTLDAVAARAGVSKGGLLYHFPAKQAMLQAMIDRLCTSFDKRTLGELDSGGGDALQLYISAALDRVAARSVSSALVAAVANDTRLMDPVREHHRRWLPQLQPAGRSFADRAILWLATEGLWLLELLELSPFNQRQRRQIAVRLVELAGRGEIAAPRTRRKSGSPRRRKRRTRSYAAK